MRKIRSTIRTGCFSPRLYHCVSLCVFFSSTPLPPMNEYRLEIGWYLTQSFPLFLFRSALVRSLLIRQNLKTRIDNRVLFPKKSTFEDVSPFPVNNSIGMVLERAGRMLKRPPGNNLLVLRHQVDLFSVFLGSVCGIVSRLVIIPNFRGEKGGKKDLLLYHHTDYCSSFFKKAVSPGGGGEKTVVSSGLFCSEFLLKSVRSKLWSNKTNIWESDKFRSHDSPCW